MISSSPDPHSVSMRTLGPKFSRKQHCVQRTSLTESQNRNHGIFSTEQPPQWWTKASAILKLKSWTKLSEGRTYNSRFPDRFPRSVPRRTSTNHESRDELNRFTLSCRSFTAKREQTTSPESMDQENPAPLERKDVPNKFFLIRWERSARARSRRTVQQPLTDLWVK